MKKTRVAQAVTKVVGRSFLVGTLVSTVLLNTLPLLRANYQNINSQTSNLRAVEKPPSSFETNWPDYVLGIAMEAEGDAQKAGIDSSAEVTEHGLERIAVEALPYIASELKTERVNVPDIHFGKLPLNLSGVYKPFTNEVMLGSGKSVADARVSLPHELAHAQLLTLPWYKRFIYNNLITFVFPRTEGESNPLNETFANVLVLEVLANQALDGDILARQVFFQELADWLTVIEIKESGGKISGNELLYYYRPGKAVVAALSGVKPEYGGIKLDATVKLITQETEKMMRSPEHRFGVPSALERYCLSPDSSIVCVTPLTKITYSGNVYGFVLTRYHQSSLGAMTTELSAVKDAFKMKKAMTLPLVVGVTSDSALNGIGIETERGEKIWVSLAGLQSGFYDILAKTGGPVQPRPLSETIDSLINR